MKISGPIALISFGVAFLLRDTEERAIFGIIFGISFLIFIFSFAKKSNTERDQEDMEMLKRAREEGIAQARAEAAMRQNARHGSVASASLNALICPICLGSGKNTGGYTCPRCNGTGRA